MATEISNGRQTVKLYSSVNRGKAMYQLAYYTGGRRVQRNFADKAEAKRVARQILGELSNDAGAVDAMATPELESLIAARRVLAPNYALHVAVEEHAQAVRKLGEISLREAVEFFLRHNRPDVPPLKLAELADQFANSRHQSGLSAHYVIQCRKTVSDLAKAFPGKTLPDLMTAELDAWLGGLTFGAKTKNGMRIMLVACGNWAEGRGDLIKGGSPFPAMVRYKETNHSVSIFTPENIASLLAKADKTLQPFLALGAFAGLRTAELQRSIGRKSIWIAASLPSMPTKPRVGNAGWSQSRTISSSGSRRANKSPARFACINVRKSRRRGSARVSCGRKTGYAIRSSPTDWPSCMTPREWRWKRATPRK
jgi:hypothetical protein